MNTNIKFNILDLSGNNNTDVCGGYCQNISDQMIPLSARLENQIVLDRTVCTKRCIAKRFEPFWCQAYLKL